MIIACICGGLIEIIIFAIGAFLAPILAVRRYNAIEKEKCKRECCKTTVH